MTTYRAMKNSTGEWAIMYRREVVGIYRSFDIACEEICKNIGHHFRIVVSVE